MTDVAGQTDCPTPQSTGPAQETAQAGYFERVCQAWHRACRVQVPMPGIGGAEG